MWKGEVQYIILVLPIIPQQIFCVKQKWLWKEKKVKVKEKDKPQTPSELNLFFTLCPVKQGF